MGNRRSGADRRSSTAAVTMRPLLLLVTAASIVLVLAGVGLVAAQTLHGRPTDTLGARLPERMPASSGATFVVDGAKGVDARGRGTPRRPWRSINYAVRHVPAKGSTILVRRGVYAEMVRIQRQGDPSNPITLRPYPGEHVTLTTPGKGISHSVWVTRARGIRVQGFEITSPGAGEGIKIENSESVEIAGCDVHDTGHSGLLVAGSASSSSGNKDIQVWNNRFHDNGGDWIAENSFWAVGDHSVYWGAVVSNTDGVDHSTYGGVIANNLFYDQPYGFQLQIGSQASGLIVTNNTFYRAYGPSPAGGAIVLYTETETPAFVTRNVLVVNNLISYAANRGVYGSGGGGLMSTNVVRNNLAFGNGQGDFLSYYGSTSNVLFTLGTNFRGRPLYVSPRTRDFRLQARSPAIGKAEPAYAPKIDFAGRRRDAAPDIGAFEAKAPPQ